MTNAVCPTCLAHTDTDAPFCTSCGQQFAPRPAPPAPYAPSAPPAQAAQTEGATIFTDPSGWRTSPPPVPPGPPPAPAPAEVPAAPARRPLLLAAAIGLPVLAIITAVALFVAATSCGTSCTATGPAVDPPPSSVGPAPGADSTEAPPTSTSSTAPTMTPGAPVIDGRHVFIPLSVTAPADAPATTCSATVDGLATPFPCTDGKYEYDGEFNTQGAVTLEVANAAGASTIANVPVAIPFFQAVIIHACSPPPCEPVSTHQAPYRNTNERPGLLDGTPVEIECWTRGDAYQTEFHVAGQPTRTTQIFYRMHSPNEGRYLWAPFVVEDFEQVVPGVAPC